jgi:NADPH-dependent glutamate synthase beta subunit-like oxidoreductase/formate hydrogenlyase subunit 6/NADH:ubiquinone oxidoreductase subunit I
MAGGPVSLQIDGREVRAEAGQSLLQACLAAGIYVPHLCYHPDLEISGGCGLCIVEVEGVAGPVSSCHTEACAGMSVSTKSEPVQELRRLTMELILSRHPPDCTTCTQYLNCELQSLKQFVGVTEELRVRKHPQPIPSDTGNPLFVRDMTKCVLCGRCVRACEGLRGIRAITLHGFGRETRTEPVGGGSLADAGCRFCGACVQVCPTGALRDKDELTRGKNRRTALVPCRYTCPAEIDVPRYVAHTRQGEYGAATAVVREKAPFPLTLGHVCDHPCESVCRRGYLGSGSDAAVAIRHLKRYAAERDDGAWKARSRQEADTGRRVAVVGSGPAGLTAAYYLRKLGHGVTVLEALPAAGGMLRVGIPEYRLPRQVIEREVAEMEAAGVEIRLNTRVDSLDGLLDDGFDAALVAVGTHSPRRLPIPGADVPAVLTAVEFLRDVHMGRDVPLGERVLVLGGGNVAFDCARVALRRGARQAEVACLECREHMLASPEEVAEAQAEGVVVHNSRTFTGITEGGEAACTVECLEVESFALDEDGCLEIEEVWGSEHSFPADTVILALGQRPALPAEWELELTPAGTIELDEFTCETSREGIFAAGDAVSGTASVIQAIASGRRAAAAVDRYLGGEGDLEERLVEVREPDPWFGPREGFAALERCQGDAEAERCLRCDVRLKMAPVRFWGDY